MYDPHEFKITNDIEEDLGKLTEMSEAVAAIEDSVGGIEDSIGGIENILQYITTLRVAPYDSGDNSWRDIPGVGFYYVGTDGPSRGYPVATGFLIHLRLPTGTIVTQLYLGNSGEMWTRRVAGSHDFADRPWVAV